MAAGAHMVVYVTPRAALPVIAVCMPGATCCQSRPSARNLRCAASHPHRASVSVREPVASFYRWDACALQVPYLVEWALFYRALQGVSRVSICDHGSTDDPHLIQDLFASRGIDGVIIEPAPEVRASSARSGTAHDNTIPSSRTAPPVHG